MLSKLLMRVLTRRAIVLNFKTTVFEIDCRGWSVFVPFRSHEVLPQCFELVIQQVDLRRVSAKESNAVLLEFPGGRKTMILVTPLSCHGAIIAVEPVLVPPRMSVAVNKTHKRRWVLVFLPLVPCAAVDNNVFHF
jgi:hypothetical protein